MNKVSIHVQWLGPPDDYWIVSYKGKVKMFDNSPKGRADLEDHVLELLGGLQVGVPAAELPEYQPIMEPRRFAQAAPAEGGHPEYGSSDGPG